MRALVLFACALLAGSGRAATVSEVVRSGAGGARGAFMGIGVGARAVGMGEAFTAVADDASAAAWNPGGLGQVRSFAAEAMFDAVGEGIGLSYAAVAVPAGPVTIGGSVAVLAFGSYELRDAAGVLGGTGTLNDAAVAASVAWPNPRWLGGRGWTGLTVEAVRETVGGTIPGAGIGGLIPLGDRAAVGWAAQHLGPPSGGFALPAAAKLGVAFQPAPPFRLSADGGYLIGSRAPFVAGGAEWIIARVFAVRAGYRYRDPATVVGGLTGVTAGAGIRMGRLGLDYAYQPFGDLAVSHRVALVYGLGRGGGEGSPPGARSVGTTMMTESAATRERVDVQYERASREYASGKFDEALATLRILVKNYPDSWEGWQLAGTCLAAKGDIDKAVQAFRQSLRIHPDNPELKRWLQSRGASK